MKKNNNFPFILKLTIFIFLSILSLLDIKLSIKFVIISIMIVIRFILIGINKNSLRIYILLLSSSAVISIFWAVFESNNLLINILNSLTKLWMLFLNGNIMFIMINRDEIIEEMLRMHVPLDVVLFIIITFNSVNYFIESFKEISKFFKARNSNINIFQKCVYILKTLSVDSLFLIVECKKVYTIYYEDIINSLGGQNGIKNENY